MATISDLAGASELSPAIYSSLQVGSLDPAWLLNKANTEPNMSDAQARDVAARYTGRWWLIE